jgi:predicted NBD/HSP70 family sugar kinase
MSHPSEPKLPALVSPCALGIDVGGTKIALLVNTLDPEAAIVGGGLGLSEGPFWEHFIAATRRSIWSDAHRDLPILRAATGSDAGWIGAALRAWQAL